ncbi:MAG TPA: M67 family metallopeptidase, partial [Gemmatimonadales bacterium]|nr:M67 family metallopeptidase [Gemmatimonadales bacterium]
HREGERAYPGECCGVLAGQPGEIKQVRRLLPVVNRRADDPHRYLIAPEDLQRAEAEVRQADLEVLGFYHSHPDHPAAPSSFDAEHAWPWYSYLIVRVDRGRAVEATSWQLAGDRSAMLPESLDVFNEV